MHQNNAANMVTLYPAHQILNDVFLALLFLAT